MVGALFYALRLLALAHFFGGEPRPDPCEHVVCEPAVVVVSGFTVRLMGRCAVEPDGQAVCVYTQIIVPVRQKDEPPRQTTESGPEVARTDVVGPI